MNMSDFDEAMNDVDWDNVDATSDRESMMEIEQHNRSASQAREDKMKAELQNMHGNGVRKSLTEAVDKYKSDSAMEREARKTVDDIEMNPTPRTLQAGGEFGDNFSANQSVNPGRKAIEVESAGDIDNVETGQSIALEGEFNRLGGGGTMRFEDGTEIQVANDVELSKAVGNKSNTARQEVESGPTGWNVRLQNAYVEDVSPDDSDSVQKAVRFERGGGSNRAQGFHDSKVEIAKEVALKQETQDMANNLSGIDEDQLREIKREVNSHSATPNGDHSLTNQLSYVYNNSGRATTAVKHTVNNAQNVDATDAQKIADEIENMSS
jgi:hypothetical protein